MGEGNLFITTIKFSVLVVLASMALTAGAAGLQPKSLAAEAQAGACTLLPAIPAEPTYPAYATSGLELRSTDPVGPFPLSALIPLSWNSIDGIWSMKLPDGTQIHLSLQVQADCDGRRFLRVVNFDQKSFRIQSEGIGLTQSNDTMVRAVMTSQSSQYMIFIRQYKVPVRKAGSKVSTVVTIRPFNGSNGDDLHLIARKASSLTLDQYIRRQKELQAQREAAARSGVR
jgi:hypothetical protein